MRKAIFAAGLAAGYVLGTRAGRERYEWMAKRARGFAHRPIVVRVRSKARSLISTGVGEVTSKFGSGAPGVVVDAGGA